MGIDTDIDLDPWAIRVLDHGWVRLRNLAGPTRRVHQDAGTFGELRNFDADDTDPANAARMSFDQTDSGRTREADLKLADYLMRNSHTTPFEMVVVWLEMKLPIFVARQFVRHRTVSINEVSGRYVTLPAEWYVPSDVGARPEGGAKQGRAAGLPEPIAASFRARLNSLCRLGWETYRLFIEHGVAPEHARLMLHLNHYTHWLWRQDLHNMMHFLRLRTHSHAQGEAQEYARAIEWLLRANLPATMDLFDKYQRDKS